MLSYRVASYTGPCVSGTMFKVTDLSSVRLCTRVHRTSYFFTRYQKNTVMCNWSGCSLSCTDCSIRKSAGLRIVCLCLNINLSRAVPEPIRKITRQNNIVLSFPVAEKVLFRRTRLWVYCCGTCSIE